MTTYCMIDDGGVSDMVTIAILNFTRPKTIKYISGTKLINVFLSQKFFVIWPPDHESPFVNKFL